VLARPTASDVLAAQAAARYCLQLASVRRLLPVVDQLVYAARRVLLRRLWSLVTHGSDACLPSTHR